jgi:hypothetical protein
MRTEKFPLRISASTFKSSRPLIEPSASASTAVAGADVFRGFPLEAGATASPDKIEVAGACDAPFAFVFLVLMVLGGLCRFKPNQKMKFERIYFEFFNVPMT